MIDATLLSPLYDAWTVARLGSVSAAADALAKTSSAVSQQLRRVERHFGVGLFEPAGRGVRLSAAGEELIAALDGLFDDAEAVYDHLARLGQTPIGRVRLAASDYLGRALLAPVLRSLAGLGATLRFEVATAHSRESVELLERGEVDAAIVSAAEDPARFQSTALFDQDFFWVGAARDTADGNGAEIDARLASEPVLRLASASFGRRLLDDYLAAHAIRPTSTIDVPSVSMLLSYAEAGVGIGLAPGLSCLDADRTRLSVVPTGLPTLTVRLLRRPRRSAYRTLDDFTERLLVESRRLAERLQKA